MANFSKISDAQRDLIKLILRSQDIGQGWRIVSDALHNTVCSVSKDNPELYEISHTDNINMIRLSERGQIISEYL